MKKGINVQHRSAHQRHARLQQRQRPVTTTTTTPRNLANATHPRLTQPPPVIAREEGEEKEEELREEIRIRPNGQRKKDGGGE